MQNSAVKLFDSFSPRYLVPNGVTCFSMVLGFASIRTSLTATEPRAFVEAAWLILYTVLLDKADGFLARRLKATSSIGVQLDSFSDFVTFGLAPAALLVRALPTLAPNALGRGPLSYVLLGVATAYALGAALRLAKFNVTTADDDPRFFRGLPSTSSGGLLASAFLAHRDLGLGEAAAVGLLGWMTLNTLLMLSNLPQPKIGPAKALWAKVLTAGVLLCGFVLIPLRKYPVFLCLLSSTVTLIGFVYGLVVQRKESGDDDPAATHALSS